MQHQTVFVKANFKPIGKNIAKKVPTGETKKGLFGGDKEVMKEVTEFQQTGYSDSEIDGRRLTEDIQSATEKLESDGYEIVSIMPITSGNHFYEWKANGARMDNHCSGGGGYGYGYGYSYTEGVTIIARKNT